MNEIEIRKETQEYATSGQELVKELYGVEIESSEQYSAFGDFLKDIKAKLNRLEERRKAITGPLNQSLKAVNSMFREAAAPYESAEGRIKTAMVQFQLRRQQEETAALQAAAKAETVEERRDALILAADVAEAPKVTGIATRASWDFEIEDASLLPREYLIPDEKAIRAMVRARGEAANIPGVKVFQKLSIAAAGR